MRDKDVISPAAFNELLAWLSSDKDEAGKKYESIRSALIRMFEGHRCIDAENLADLTIDRVSTRVKDIRPTYVGDPAPYFQGVARKILLEHNKIRPVESAETLTNQEVPETFGVEYECLKKCLENLPDNQSDLILEYYLDSKSAKIERRRAQAAELGIDPGTLRIRAHRIRLTLERCVKKCLARQKN